MEYVYPSIFKCNEDYNYMFIYPDLHRCISEGKTIGNAMYMAQSSLNQWLSYLIDKKQDIPTASPTKMIKTTNYDIVNLFYVEVKNIKAIKRTFSSPKWMNDKAIHVGLVLSKLLQDKLWERLA